MFPRGKCISGSRSVFQVCALIALARFCGYDVVSLSWEMTHNFGLCETKLRKTFVCYQHYLLFSLFEMLFFCILRSIFLFLWRRDARKLPNFANMKLTRFGSCAFTLCFVVRSKREMGLEFVSQREHASIKIFWSEVIRESHIKVLSKHHTNVRSYKCAQFDWSGEIITSYEKIMWNSDCNTCQWWNEFFGRPSVSSIETNEERWNTTAIGNARRVGYNDRRITPIRFKVTSFLLRL